MDLRAINTKHGTFSKIFSLLAAQQGSIAGDSANSHSIDTIKEVQSLLYSEVQGQYIANGQQFCSLDECKAQVKMKLMAGDSIFNPQTGVGTLSDPNQFTTANIPVMFGPIESASVYATGGLPATIIDKKTKGMVSQGATFRVFDEEVWPKEKVAMLEEAAEITGLNDGLTAVIRDANIYGGALIHPVFQNDSVSSFSRRLDKMSLDIGCVKRWVVADRWNVVYVPSYDLTADDYLRPETVYLPLGGYAVSTTRCALVRPRMMPYWALLYNIGWVPSDFTGWIRSFLGYNMLIQAIPIMAQQMSLLLYEIPLDALVSSIGLEKAKELMSMNENQIKDWSMLHPKAVNMIGKVQTVNRTFSGFEQFVGALKSDLASECGIPEPVLFHTPNKGFSDNTTEALMKESEAMKMQQRAMEPQLVYLTDALVAHCWGNNSEEWKQRRRVVLSFDKPMVTTEKDMAEIGARYAATVSSLSTSNIPPSDAIIMASQFFKSVKIDDDILDRVKEAYEQQIDMQQQAVDAGVQKAAISGSSVKATSGQGHSLASQGTAKNVGRFTTPKGGH